MLVVKDDPIQTSIRDVLSDIRKVYHVESSLFYRTFVRKDHPNCHIIYTYPFTTMPSTETQISIIIPIYNEEPSIRELHQAITQVTSGTYGRYEILFVNDGSTDNTEDTLKKLRNEDPEHVSCINFDQNYGKALALRAGFTEARGDIFITMDGDLQDDPTEIPRFVEKIEGGYDLVSGWKVRRLDSFVKNNTSKIYNAVTSLASGVYLHDHNCGFKAYRREVALGLPLHGQLHRYIPLLASANGYEMICEIEVNHRKRQHGTTKYGPSRFIYGITGLVHALSIAHKVKENTIDGMTLPTYHLKDKTV